MKNAARGLVWFSLVLRLTPRMQDEKAWTDIENKVVAQHFSRLKQAARVFMESDPAMVANMMTATLHPYAAAPQRKP